ncbi:hypothetical protein EJ04DRAFT_517095 [Polyplosphaeria fusca]|uniref:Uncharacterized protein n=1 Tax=Polyplosphaeria fusca TaxID=682080 RepID=A0A9P4QMJ1_9PLEO|nr:hypothetical protein EJ04DRAFT_517095 [Polyplosphaeria fusca]
MSEVQLKPEEILANFEELSVLESEFEDAEAELIRQSEKLNAPLYQKRAEVAAKIPHFWALVLEQAPPELDTFLQPSDSKVFAECLESIDVSRFEVDSPKGSPRSFSVKFTFKENPYFSNTTLEKKFWFRTALDGWQGHVSEPVKIDWKKGQDMTGGLTDAAFELHQARQKLNSGSKAPKVKETTMPEYKALAKKIESSNDFNSSFFGWFAFVSSYKPVTASESEKAVEIERENVEKQRRGEKVEEREDDDDDQDFQEVEVFPQGDEVAIVIAEDVWPSAIKYYKQIHEQDDEELSDLEVEDLDDDDDDSGDEIDIRGLVGKGRNTKSSGNSPPAKKQRQV